MRADFDEVGLGMRCLPTVKMGVERAEEIGVDLGELSEALPGLATALDAIECCLAVDQDAQLGCWWDRVKEHIDGLQL